MDTHFTFYVILILAFIAGILIMRKVASCLLKLIIAAVALGVVAALFVVFGITYSSIRAKNAVMEKEYIALQTEMADYDIFLEIN